MSKAGGTVLFAFFRKAKRTVRLIIILIIISLSCLSMFIFAESKAKIIQGTESDAKVVYNGKEVSLGLKPVLIEGYNYLSVRAVSSLFDKNIYWEQKENKISITDKTDPVHENLVSELSTKNKQIEELEAKVKKLENELASKIKLSIRELQDEINDEYGEYEGVSYKVILSGNEDEIRVKIEVDLSRDKSEWKRLSISGREELIEEIYLAITREYGSAKIKGYIKDISASQKLLSFYYNWDNELVKGNYKNYSAISTIEEKFNNDYASYFRGIHLAFTLDGNDNRVEYTVYIKEERFEEKWAKLTDTTLKNFMKKLCDEINNEFKECYVLGSVSDIDSGSELAYCERAPKEEYIFIR